MVGSRKPKLSVKKWKLKKVSVKLNNFQDKKIKNIYEEMYFLSQHKNGQHNRLSALMSFIVYLETKIKFSLHSTLLCPNSEHIPRRQYDTNGNPTHHFFFHFCNDIQKKCSKCLECSHNF